MILHFQLALPCCTANPPTHTYACTHTIHYCDRYCGRCDGDWNRRTSSTEMLWDSSWKKKERKKSKFRPNEVKKASGRASQERNQLFMHNEPTHTHTHAHTYTHILNTQGKTATCDITCSVCVVCSHNVYFSYTGVYVYCDGFY